MEITLTDDRFYMNTEENSVTEKEGEWEFLRMFGRDDENDDDEDDDSAFSQEPVKSSGQEESDEDEDSTLVFMKKTRTTSMGTKS